MEKIVVGPEGRDLIDLDRSPSENLRALAEAKGVYVADLTVAILDRPRHEALVSEVRKAGASAWASTRWSRNMTRLTRE
jgi:fructose-1,6-bisphosphatase II